MKSVVRLSCTNACLQAPCYVLALFFSHSFCARSSLFCLFSFPVLFSNSPFFFSSFTISFLCFALSHAFDSSYYFQAMDFLMSATVSSSSCSAKIRPPGKLHTQGNLETDRITTTVRVVVFAAFLFALRTNCVSSFVPSLVCFNFVFSVLSFRFPRVVGSKLTRVLAVRR